MVTAGRRRRPSGGARRVRHRGSGQQHPVISRKRRSRHCRGAVRRQPGCRSLQVVIGRPRGLVTYEGAGTAPVVSSSGTARRSARPIRRSSPSRYPGRFPDVVLHLPPRQQTAVTPAGRVGRRNEAVQDGPPADPERGEQRRPAQSPGESRKRCRERSSSTPHSEETTGRAGGGGAANARPLPARSRPGFSRRTAGAGSSGRPEPCPRWRGR